MGAQRSAALAARLARVGVPITLIDGRTVNVAYGFAGLRKIEAAHGGLQPVLEMLKGGADATIFTALADILAAGLVHENIDGEQLSSPDVLADWLDPTQIGPYGEAIGQAFALSFPASTGNAKGETATETANSPGTSGTTSAPSGTDAPMMSSGA